MLVAYTVVADTLDFAMVAIVCIVFTDVDVDELAVDGRTIDGVEVEDIADVVLVFTCVIVVGVDV